MLAWRCLLAAHDWRYGANRAWLEDLVAYWADGYDWRAAEKAINAYDHYRVDVGDVPVHFLRRPGVGPAPVPLILSHGWPWTFWHWSKVIDRLADPAGHELLEDRRRLARTHDRCPRLPEVRRRRV